MMTGSNSLEKNTATVSPVEDDEEDTNPPATRQQKLIKAGLLAVLVAIVLYVVLDYTVSCSCCSRGTQQQEDYIVAGWPT